MENLSYPPRSKKPAGLKTVIFLADRETLLFSA